MARRAILHIGTFKTGSTSIQGFLDANADRLAAKGVRFPLSLGRPNHHGLTVYALSERETTGLIRHLNLHDRQEREEKRAAIAADLAAELAALPADVSTVVFSNEHLCGLNTQAEIERLRDLLAPHFDAMTVLVYLRRQDQRIISDYTQKVRDGYTKPLDLLSYEPAERRDHAVFLDKWAAVFGAGALAPRVFSRSRFVDGDLIDDFLEAIGVADDAAFVRPPRENPGLSHEAIEFLRLLNRHLPLYEEGARNSLRDRLLPFLAEAFAGDGVRVSKGEAEALLALVGPSNADVAARYFGGAPAFDNDLSRYPDEPPPAPSFEDAVKIAAHLWTRQAQTINVLKAENERRIAQLAALRTLVVVGSDTARSLAGQLLSSDPAANAYYPTLIDAFVALHAELRAARRGIAPAPLADDQD